MPTRKTGTVTGSTLNPKERSKKAKPESATPIAETASETVLESPMETPRQSPTESTAVPTPSSVIEKLQEIGNGVATTLEKGAQAISAVQGFTSRIQTAIQKTETDHNPSAITNGQVNISQIMASASADIDENVPQLDSAEAIKRNIIIARQRNYVGVAINNTQLKQDIQKLNNEQQKLIGLIVDGKKLEVENQTKAVQFHRATTKRDTEISALEEDRELQLQQEIKTEGTQAQTPLIQQKEQLKVVKLKEEIEKMGHEINNLVYEKEKVKSETEAKFLAGF